MGGYSSWPWSNPRAAAGYAELGLRLGEGEPVAPSALPRGAGCLLLGRAGMGALSKGTVSVVDRPRSTRNTPRLSSTTTGRFVAPDHYLAFERLPSALAFPAIEYRTEAMYLSEF